MFFQNKIKRSFDTVKYLTGETEKREKIEEFKKENRLEFKDILAMIISGIMVFGPIFLIILLILFLIF